MHVWNMLQVQRDWEDPFKPDTFLSFLILCSAMSHKSKLIYISEYVASAYDILNDFLLRLKSVTLSFL